MVVAPAVRPFVDAELAIVTLLGDMVAEGSIDIESPANVQDIVPFIRVERIGGPSTQLSDSPRIAIDIFGAVGTRPATSTLAFAVQARLRSYPHVIAGVGVIDRVDTDISPNQVPWNNDAVILYTASYKVTVR